MLGSLYVVLESSSLKRIRKHSWRVDDSLLALRKSKLVIRFGFSSQLLKHIGMFALVPFPLLFPALVINFHKLSAHSASVISKRWKSHQTRTFHTSQFPNRFSPNYVADTVVLLWTWQIHSYIHPLLALIPFSHMFLVNVGVSSLVEPLNELTYALCSKVRGGGNRYAVRHHQQVHPLWIITYEMD